MPICSYCQKVVAEECLRCKAPDHMIERKYAKHDGGVPVSSRQGRVPNDKELPKTYVWPKFKKGTKPNDDSGADRVS